MYNPRFPHTLVVKRVKKNEDGDIAYSEKGDVSYDIVPLDIVQMLGDSPLKDNAGNFITRQAGSLSFGYRTSTRNVSQSGEVVVADIRISTPMFTTELFFDDIIILTDYDKTYECRFVKKTTFNWGTSMWVDEIKN